MLKFKLKTFDYSQISVYLLLVLYVYMSSHSFSTQLEITEDKMPSSIRANISGDVCRFFVQYWYARDVFYILHNKQANIRFELYHVILHRWLLD